MSGVASGVGFWVLGFQEREGLLPLLSERILTGVTSSMAQRAAAARLLMAGTMCLAVRGWGGGSVIFTWGWTELKLGAREVQNGYAIHTGVCEFFFKLFFYLQTAICHC